MNVTANYQAIEKLGLKTYNPVIATKVSKEVPNMTQKAKADKKSVNPDIPDPMSIQVGEGERRLPVYLLLDTSASMTGAPIEAVRRGMEQFRLEVQGDTFALETVWVGIITFGGRAEFVTRGLVPFSQFSSPQISAEGQTPLGQAFWLLIESLDKDLRRPVKGGPRGDWRPLVFILTDGEPTDDWREPREKIIQREAARVCKFVTVGCGPYINQQNLRDIAIGHTLNMGNDDSSFAGFFAYVSTIVREESRSCSQTGGTMDETPEPPPVMKQFEP